MILVNADKINKSYTETPLLQDISLSIHEGEKIGLIGVNGTGKSTLLKIVAGIEEPDSGRVVYTNDVKRAFLPQHPEYDGDLTVAEQAAEYMAEVDPKTPDFACRSMMTKLGVRDFDAKMKELSGGADFLILDEPTNHMDNDVIAYLEDFLVKYKGAVLMITHDRYFLDRVTKKIFEIDGGSLYSYDGNYDYYLETKAAREEMLLASERKRAALYKKELAWIRRGARARSTKAKSHIERFEELRDSKLIIDDSSLSIGTVSSRLGKKIIEIENLSKAYGEKQLIRDFTYTVLRNDRIGIIGDNGSGKSTFLKMILGEVEPDQGIITIGQTVKIGYFSQDTQVWDPNQRVIKYVEGISDNVRTEDGYLSASQMLERFLFPSIKHSLPIGRLSGGEKRRLYLLSVLMQAPNVLILDEPTAVLTPQETEKLFNVLRNMRADGKAIVIITHKLHEVMALSDRVAVLRKGKYIGTVHTADTDPQKLTEMMVGRAVSLNIDRPEAKYRDLRLEVKGLTCRDHEGIKTLDDVSFQAFGGEILGIAGIAGSGQKELLEAIAGLQAAEAGSVLYYPPHPNSDIAGYHVPVDRDGEELVGKTPMQIRRVGVSLAFVPEDRLGMGLVAGMDMVDNMMLKTYREHKGPFVDRKAPRALAQRLIDELEIVTPGVGTPVRRLSGGNVQKVLVGREIDSTPTVLMTAYPVRGLDINSSYTIYGLLNQQKMKGVAVLLVGEDLDVLLELCDRILVLCGGKVSGIVDGRNTTKEEVGLYMTHVGGGKEAGERA